MSRKLSQKEVENVKKAQTDAKNLLSDRRAFNKRFDEIFQKYDKNKDGSIDLTEYIPFLKDMITSMGRKEYSFDVAILNFERADKDQSGAIDKEEFKKEFTKRLREFANSRIQ